MRRRSMDRPRRPSNAFTKPAIAVSRNTGAMDSWMTCVMSSKAGMAPPVYRRLAFPAGLEPRPDHGHEAHGDDPDDDQREVALDPGDVAEEETGVGERGDPQQGAHHVEGGEAPRVHGAQARHERDVGAHD